MYSPPPDGRPHTAVTEPTWQSILVSYLLVAAIPLVLLVVSQPLAGVVVLAALVSLAVVLRRVVRLARCFYDCGGFSFDLGESVRIAITRPDVDDVC